MRRFPPGLGEAPIEPTTPPPTPEFYPEWSFYNFTRTLTANQELLDQSIAIDGDSDFWWMALLGCSTGTYELRFKLPSGRYVCSARLPSPFLVGTAQLPGPVVPFVWCPASGRIGVDVRDTSGAGNTINLGLRGYRNFPRR